MHAEMKSFTERNPAIIGAVGVGATAAIVLGALNYQQLPGFRSSATYSAYFADAGGLKTGSEVQISGVSIGKVDRVTLDGSRVLIQFGVPDGAPLGDRTEAAIETNTLLGTKILTLSPRGSGRLSETIPLERTRSPYQLPDALSELTRSVSGIDTAQLSQSLATLTETFRGTPPDVRRAAEGVARFSQTLANRDDQLRNLLTNATKATAVLSQRTDQVVGLIRDTNALLVELLNQSSALDQIASNVSQFSRQLSATIDDNRAQLRPALEKLNGVLAIVDNRKERVQQSIKLLNAYATSLGESVASGPFFNAYVANLLPGQFVQPFVDAAFSDLGLDPNVLLPSQLTDPQTGQPGTPALPSPYPRTGQGGDPHLSLPDAITGNPGDPRYPYREPLPAPPPGGPPPGPPGPIPPEQRTVPPPEQAPVYVPAPGEQLGPPPGPSTEPSPPTEGGN